MGGTKNLFMDASIDIPINMVFLQKLVRLHKLVCGFLCFHYLKKNFDLCLIDLNL